jgi:hypothetical protein
MLARDARRLDIDANPSPHSPGDDPMSAAPTAAPRRHAWGLPAGSIRALLALGVLGLLCLLAFVKLPGDEKPLLNPQVQLTFVYLNILMVLILVHFFTAHGKSIGRHISGRSPLGLPAGSMRVILLGGYLAMAASTYYMRQDFQIPEKANLMLLISVLLGGYFLGWLIAGCVRLMYGDWPPAPYQDIQAWFAMLALLGLGILVMVHLIAAHVEQNLEGTLEYINAILAALVGVYFGSRS